MPRGQKPCKTNDDYDYDDDNDDDGIMFAEKARKIAKTEPPCATTRLQSQALFVVPNRAHPAQ
jgi:hypothetical protein